VENVYKRLNLWTRQSIMINPARNVVKVELSMEKCNVILATSVFNKKKEFKGFRRLIKRQSICLIKIQGSIWNNQNVKIPEISHFYFDQK
jgi:hypothetical protein